MSRLFLIMPSVALVGQDTTIKDHNSLYGYRGKMQGGAIIECTFDPRYEIHCSYHCPEGQDCGFPKLKDQPTFMRSKSRKKKPATPRVGNLNPGTTWANTASQPPAIQDLDVNLLAQAYSKFVVQKSSEPIMELYDGGEKLLTIYNNGKSLTVNRDGTISGDLTNDEAALTFWRAVAMASSSLCKEAK